MGRITVEHRCVAAPLLAAEGIGLSYGALQVLFGATIHVPDAGRVALVGTNGAGKTSLLHVLAGLLQPSAGRIWLDGEDITRVPAEARTERGVALVAGGRATFPSLSVEDNLLIGAYPFRKDRRRARDGLEAALALFPQLRPRLRQQAGTLSGGEQQMVALGRALVGAPRLLLIDELSLGLAPVVLRAIVPAVAEMTAGGTALLLVEQSLPLALELTDEMYVMESGVTRRAGTTDELADDDALASQLLGIRS